MPRAVGFHSKKESKSGVRKPFDSKTLFFEVQHLERSVTPNDSFRVKAVYQDVNYIRNT